MLSERAEAFVGIEFVLAAVMVICVLFFAAIPSDSVKCIFSVESVLH